MSAACRVRLWGAWKAVVAGLDPSKVQGRLERNIRVANARIGRQWVQLARSKIRNGDYAPNSPITVILKGSSKPLVAGGDLYQAITYTVPDWRTLRVGLFRARSGGTVNIGIILHEGATIDVGAHPAVRRRVWAMVRAALGADRLAALNRRSRTSVLGAARELGMGRRGRLSQKQRAYLIATGKITPRPIYGTSGGKRVWTLPARPFIRDPLDDASIGVFARKTYGQAIKAALTIERR